MSSAFVRVCARKNVKFHRNDFSLLPLLMPVSFNISSMCLEESCAECVCVCVVHFSPLMLTLQRRAGKV
jgi:hypothetical protein